VDDGASRPGSRGDIAAAVGGTCHNPADPGTDPLRRRLGQSPAHIGGP
jgi:hypothetical protein